MQVRKQNADQNHAMQVCDKQRGKKTGVINQIKPRDASVKQAKVKENKAENQAKPHDASVNQVKGKESGCDKTK